MGQQWSKTIDCEGCRRPLGAGGGRVRVHRRRGSSALRRIFLHPEYSPHPHPRSHLVLHTSARVPLSPTASSSTLRMQIQLAGRGGARQGCVYLRVHLDSPRPQPSASFPRPCVAIKKSASLVEEERVHTFVFLFISLFIYLFIFTYIQINSCK